MEFHSHNEAETEAIGARLAAVLNPGAVVAYLGDLGMGKTAFTRGLAAGLGYKGRVTSPTFAIVNEYEGGRLPLFHFDMYRLGSSEELFDIGWEDYLARGGVCAVEWSENVADALERDTVRVDIRRGGEESRRVISVEMMVSSLVTLWSFLPSLRLSKCFMPLAVSMIQSSIWIGGFWWAQKSSIAYIWFSTVCFPVLTLT